MFQHTLSLQPSKSFSVFLETTKSQPLLFIDGYTLIHIIWLGLLCCCQLEGKIQSYIAATTLLSFHWIESEMGDCLWSPWQKQLGQQPFLWPSLMPPSQKGRRQEVSLHMNQTGIRNLSLCQTRYPHERHYIPMWQLRLIKGRWKQLDRWMDG